MGWAAPCAAGLPGVMERQSLGCIDGPAGRTMGQLFLHFSYLSFGFPHIWKTSSLQVSTFDAGIFASWIAALGDWIGRGQPEVRNWFERAFNARSWWINFITSSALEQAVTASEFLEEMTSMGTWSISVLTLNSSLREASCFGFREFASFK